MKRKAIFLLLLILGTAFWGISFPVTKLSMGTHPSATFLFFRFLLATIVLTIIFWKQVKTVNLSSLKIGALLAIPLFAGIQLQTLGIKHSPASQCAFIAGLTVIIVPLTKLIVYRKAASPKIWFASLVALTGLFIISAKEHFTIAIGDLYTITGAFAFAVYLILVEKYAAKYNMLKTMVPMLVTCTLLTACLLPFTSDQTNWLPTDHNFWIGIGFCALFSTAYMYTVSNVSQRYISAERIAIIYLLEPVFGAIAAYFILGEMLTARVLVGGTLILTAMLICEIDFRKIVLQWKMKNRPVLAKPVEVYSDKKSNDGKY
jgi:drug/metabolite transporter (DMT)-like permease